MTIAGVGMSAATAIVTGIAVFSRSTALVTAESWLYCDALSAWHLLILTVVVFFFCSLYAKIYFREEIDSEEFSTRRARRFSALWCGSLFTMTLVLISNNVAIIWAGMEATTLLTAFLICLHRTPAALEATWKYLIMCSVGVAFAFIGTLLVVAASEHSGLNGEQRLLWTHLNQSASLLNSAMAKFGFIFLLVGYGTKAGLAPMHNWLPDAHSQAPAPVSALFSGFMLNTALYCIMRYMPIVNTATGGGGWPNGLTMLFALFSILLAAVFIIFQTDAKRLLAYHSVEHMGIILLGLSYGGFGIFAALYHTLNHSLAKTAAFFSAGRLGQLYGTHDMRTMAGSLRNAKVWGFGFFVSLLGLIGVAPFAVFMSELQITKVAVGGHAWISLCLFLAGIGTVFISALHHAMTVAWDNPVRECRAQRPGLLEWIVMLVPCAMLLGIGLWIPQWIFHAIRQAAAIVGGTP
jgi:hydrogenase-4 component F